MIHLKKFNESIDEDQLKDFCESSLAYLLDEGFRIDFFNIVGTNNSIKIKLHKPNERKVVSFKWSEINDYYIPFLQLLLKRYDLDYYYDPSVDKYKMRREDKEQIKKRTFVYIQSTGSAQYLRLETVLNDSSLLDDLNIVSILIKVLS